MVLRNSGRVGSRRFLEREAPVSEDAGAFLFFGVILSALPYTCLVLLVFLFFVLLVFLRSADF